jgi:hypothetical protein
MKGKIKNHDRLTQSLDHEDNLDKQNSSAKNKKQGHKAHTDKFINNWESDDAAESYVKGKAYARDGRRQH